MEALLAQLADVGGPAFLLLLVFRFFPQFDLLLDRAREFAGEVSDRAQIFASRTTVIIVRPIWWIVLPATIIAFLVSSISAFVGLFKGVEGAWSWVWWSLNTVGLATVIGIQIWRCVVAYKVRHVPVDDPWFDEAERSEADIQARYGKSWQLVPMVMSMLGTLAATTALTLSNTWLVADRVHYYHSLVNDMASIGMSVITFLFAVAMFVGLALIAKIGIDVGGGAWNGIAVPIGTALIPLLTRTNNQVIAISDAARHGARAAVDAAGERIWFIAGALAAWALWNLSFHSALAWFLELVVMTGLILILIGYIGITRKTLLRVAEVITLIVLVLGGVMLAWRLIDAAVPGPQPVMFYDRFASAFGWFGGDSDPASGLGCFIAGVPRASLLLVGLIAVVLGWLASRTDGKRSRILFLVAALVGLPVVGIVTARAMTPDGYLCAASAVVDAPNETATDTSAASTASPPPSGMGQTVIAGTHPPREPACTRCPGRSTTR